MAPMRSPPRSAAAACALTWALALAACADGYPTEDEPRLDPSGMSRPQLLDALNDLGAEQRLGKRWRYTLDAGCMLDVDVQRGDPPRRRVGVADSRVDTREVDGLTHVRLTPRDGKAEAPSVVVLETPKWTDGVRARSLLAQLALRCRPPAPGTP